MKVAGEIAIDLPVARRMSFTTFSAGAFWWLEFRLTFNPSRVTMSLNPLLFNHLNLSQGADAGQEKTGL